MSCVKFRERLALAAGGDLGASEALEVDLHLSGCTECLAFYERLQGNQTMLRSLRQDTLPPASLAALRQGVLAQIADPGKALGWGVRFERFLLQGLRRPSFAIAGGTIVAVILSLSLFGQIRFSSPQAAGPGIAFEGSDTLRRPEGYREWIFVGSFVASEHPAGQASSELRGHLGYFHSVYINPGAYREYEKSGKFPEGTVMILESSKSATHREPGLHGSYAKELVGLEASVKDSRFEGGWGYFDFTGPAKPAPTPGNEGVEIAGVEIATRAKALPVSAGCLACHRDRADKDHVFTQFYPVLSPVSKVL